LARNCPVSKVCKTELQALDGTVLDPCVALNPESLFQDFNYRDLIGTRICMRKVWINEEFREIVIKKWDSSWKIIDVNIKKRARDDDDDDDDDEHGSFIILEQRLFRYPWPHRVIRMDSECIGSIKTPAAIFPFRLQTRFLGDEHKLSTPNVPFPILSKTKYQERKSEMSRQEKQLITMEADALSIDWSIPCDRIFRRYFATPSEKMDATRFRDGVNQGPRRYREVFHDFWASLRADNYDQPFPLRNALKYIESVESIFPDVLKFPGFNRFKNLSPYGTFLVKFTENYIEGALQCRHLHRVINFLLFMIPLQFRPKYGYQMQIIIHGVTSTGKSFLPDILRWYGIEDTMIFRDSESPQALSSDEGHDNKFIVVDDANMDNAPLLRPNGGIE
jgi:hypothetical protein